MGKSKKRKIEEDPTRSDSDDETYDEKPERASRPRPSRAPLKKKAKRPRQTYARDDSEFDSEVDSEESLDPPSPMPEVELDERTGRPKRASARKTVRYQDPDSDEAELVRPEETDLAEEAEEHPPSPKRKPGQILKLRLTTKLPSAASTRTTRAGSRPTSRRGQSGEPLSAGTRRSSRLHHDDTETILALSDSGNHSTIVRAGTRSPDLLPKRSTRSGKSLPQPNISPIREEDEQVDLEAESQRLENAPEKAESTASRTQPSSRPRLSPGNGDAILSVEDSDPERVQEMEKSASKKSVNEEETASQAEELTAEHIIQVARMGEDEPAHVQAADVEADDGDDEDDVPLSRGRRGTRKVDLDSLALGRLFVNDFERC